jgi:transcriptional regulator
MEARLTLPQALQGALQSAEPKALKELSAELGVSEKVLPEALEKLNRSLRRTEQRLYQVHPKCLDCAFDFRERERFTRPSRCPSCKSERITPARFWIE